MSEEQLKLIEDTANLLRGMCFDLRIPLEARNCMMARALELEALVELFFE